MARNNKKRYKHGNDAVKIDAFLRGVIASETQNPNPSIAPGTLRVLTVRHDDWCAMWKGGVCNCNPGLELGDPIKGEE